MILRRVLRASAFAIVLLALIDPPVTSSSAGRPTVALSVSGDRSDDAAARTRAAFVQALRDDVDIREQPGAQADAYVVVGDDDYPEDVMTQDGARVFGLRAHGRDEPRVRVEDVSAPARASLFERLHVDASLRAVRLQGRTLQAVLLRDAVEVARHPHVVSSPDDRWTASFDVLPAQPGLARFTVDIREGDATRARADAGVEIVDRALPVLLIEPRPSWSATFVRRALEQDRRLAIVASTVVSRGLTVRGGASASTPSGDTRTRATIDRAALDRATLGRVAAVIVFAPEGLTADQVDALDWFARIQGGTVVFVPDARPDGAYVRLLPGSGFGERLIDQPVRVRAPRIAGDASWSATEWLTVRALLPGTEVVASSVDGDASRPAILASPRGAGRIVLVTALDAWRFRQTDAAGFARLWTDLTASWAARTPPPVDITVQPRVVLPGDPVHVTIRLRDAAAGAAGAPHEGERVRVQVAPRDSSREQGGESADRPSESATFARVWPDAVPGTFRGRLNAPLRGGVYAVSATASQEQPAAIVPLLVSSDARMPAPPWAALDAWVGARGGRIYDSHDVDRLAADLRASVQSADRSSGIWRPMRSAWWLLPLAACLGAEWCLRRRAGAH